MASVQDDVYAALEGMYTALPGKVVSYSPKTCRASVVPAVSKRMADGSSLAPPTIEDVPVSWPVTMGGKCFMSAPMQAGDSVLLVFSQRSIEHWKSGSSQAPSDPRWHDMSDCFAIPTSDHRSINTDGKSLALKYGPTEFMVYEDSRIVINGNIIHNGDYTHDGNMKRTGDTTHTGEDVHTGNITRTGNTNQTGAAAYTADVVAGGKVSLISHIHDGVTPGDKKSGPPA